MFTQTANVDTLHSSTWFSINGWRYYPNETYNECEGLEC